MKLLRQQDIRFLIFKQMNKLRFLLERENRYYGSILLIHRQQPED
jgi:hypothetical protein